MPTALATTKAACIPHQEQAAFEYFAQGHLGVHVQAKMEDETTTLRLEKHHTLAKTAP